MREAVAIPAEAKQAVLFLSSCQWAFVHRASTAKGIAERLLLHRGGLQQAQAPFGARLSEPAAVRGSTHPADWPNSSLITVHPQGITPVPRDEKIER